MLLSPSGPAGGAPIRAQGALASESPASSSALRLQEPDKEGPPLNVRVKKLHLVILLNKNIDS